MSGDLPISVARAPMRIAARGAVMALIWLGLNGKDWNSWIVGIPAVLAAAFVLRGWPEDTSQEEDPEP